MKSPSRREILCAFASVPLFAQPGQHLYVEAGTSVPRRRASRELLRGLIKLGVPGDIRLVAGEEAFFELRVQLGRFKDPEHYEIETLEGKLRFTGGSERGLLYAIYDFLERQGAFFGIDGESYPLDPVTRLLLPPPEQPWKGAPRFAVRGLLPWPDFLNCITVFNDEDFRAYFESMIRMRFNTFGMHVYTGPQQWAESYLSFEYGGVGHLSQLDTSATNRWGYLPQRTSRFGMGASQFYEAEVFGSEATRLARDPWEQAARTTALLKQSLSYAKRMGLKTGIGFEPYQIPDEIWRALPPEVRPREMPPRNQRGPRFDVESVAARKMLEARLAQLLSAYPEVDHVWLWEDEGMSWESQRTSIPLSVTPFKQAHDFLKRHAPDKRLVLAGWGGVARHFEAFHKQLPGDVVFACLSDMTGWDPVNEAFSKLEGRERWPIPWLEDDPGMWQVQLHANRFERDMNLAEQYGCQGLMGIHWRHRIVDPTAGFQSRFSWSKDLTTADYYSAYARTQAAGTRGPRLAAVLADADSNHKLLSTGTGESKDGHMATRAFSGDYGEAFNFGANYAPDEKVMQSQKEIAAALRAIANEAKSPLEKERLEYLTKHVEMLAPYADSWIVAQKLQRVLDDAAKMEKPAARDKVRAEAVPLWLQLAPKVRDTMLNFQSIVATRSDLGTLASMHNKYVRLSLVRLRMSMEEYLGQLPPEMEKLYAEVIKPDAKAVQRLIVPTRPSILQKGETVRMLVINNTASPVILNTRIRGDKSWTPVRGRLIARQTWQVTLGPFDVARDLVEYQVVAGRVVSPVYLLTLA